MKFNNGVFVVILRMQCLVDLQCLFHGILLEASTAQDA